MRNKGLRCEVDGCVRDATRKGLCGAHRARLTKTGSLGPAAIRPKVVRLPDACGADDCNRVPVARGYCQTHLTRVTKYGSPDGRMVEVPRHEYFFRHVEFTGDCWNWTGMKRKGYGRFSNGARNRPCTAHRWSYEFLVGPVPDGLELDHLCRNRACVNPAHLEPVTHDENVKRAQLSRPTTSTKE